MQLASIAHSFFSLVAAAWRQFNLRCRLWRARCARSLPQCQFVSLQLTRRPLLALISGEFARLSHSGLFSERLQARATFSTSIYLFIRSERLERPMTRVAPAPSCCRMTTSQIACHFGVIGNPMPSRTSHSQASKFVPSLQLAVQVGNSIEVAYDRLGSAS